MKKVLVVGGGFGGLAAAVELAYNGFEVTVLESHVDPGGCASTFYHKGYNFDAGATLAGGFAPGAPMDLISNRYNINWNARSDSPAMMVHLPDRTKITRYSDQAAWQEERLRVFGLEAEKFWTWQESTADAMWNLAMMRPSWPPQTPLEFLQLVRTSGSWLKNHLTDGGYKGFPDLIADGFRPVSSHLTAGHNPLRQYVDGQLLISAQTTSQHANALYGASAMDLPRRGIGHPEGGMGGMAEKLVEAIRRFGSNVYFRQEVSHIRATGKNGFMIRTRRKDSFPADIVILNLPPWNIGELFEGQLPAKIRALPDLIHDSWGAFTVYLGVKDRIVPAGYPLHHQRIVQEPMREGNSIFLSISPVWDTGRAPGGKRAITISTHTLLEPWWNLYSSDPDAYSARKEEYTEKITGAAEDILPGITANAELVLPGTPVTFQRFTNRAFGWVGGFPQINLFQNWGPRLGKNIWMVGDTIFPGQSVPAVSLGGLRVANSILAELGAGAFYTFGQKQSASKPGMIDRSKVDL